MDWLTKAKLIAWGNVARLCEELGDVNMDEESVLKFIQDLYDESGRGEYPNKPHPYRKEMIAWINGADIEHKISNEDKWFEMPVAANCKGFDYRPKPKKSAKDIEIENIQSEMDKLNKRLDQLKGE